MKGFGTNPSSNLLLAFAVVMAFSATVPAQNHNWKIVSSMPTPKAAFSADEVDGLIYVVSGDTGSLPTANTVEAFNPLTREWTEREPIPTARVVFASAVAGGKIYVFGGQVDISSPDLGTVEAYDPATNTWETVAPMPTARRLLSASSLNGKIYAIGGVAGPGTAGKLSKVEVYDPVSDTWDITASDMAVARWGLSTAVLNGKIYAIGGVTDHPIVTTVVEAYDPVTNEWTTVDSLPAGKVAFAATELNGRIYAIGGSLDSFPYGFIDATVEEYDPVTDTWSDHSLLGVGRSFLSCSAANGRLYVFGGHTAEIFANMLAPEVEEFDPSVTAIDAKDETTPEAFTLVQNYPNPFNPTTTLSFTIHKSDHVLLRIYNTLGEEIQTLVNRYKSAGSYSLNFNAGKLPSGLYTYRLQSGNYIATRKMILLR